MKTSVYPVDRAYQLVEVVRGICARLAHLLSRKCEMIPYEEFHAIFSSCTKLFRTWDEHVGAFRELARELFKRRGDGAFRTKTLKSSRRMEIDHALLQQRIEEVGSFRRNHQKLCVVFKHVLVKSRRVGNDDASGTGGNAMNDVELAYENFSSIDVLDTSEEGNLSWESAKRSYESASIVWSPDRKS